MITYVLATVAGAVFMLSLCMAPGPRVALLVAASRFGGKTGRYVLTGYVFTDIIFAVLAVISAHVLAYWDFMIPLACLATFCLVVFLAASDIVSLRRGVNKVSFPACESSFREAVWRSFSNLGLTFDALVPIATSAFFFRGKPLLTDVFVGGSCMGGIGWMVWLHYAAQINAYDYLSPRSWFVLIVVKIFFLSIVLVSMSLTFFYPRLGVF